jgi:site-specific DNA-methyltransferase (adenine-specific)
VCLDCGACRIDKQLGLERTPEEYVATMVGVFREVRRVLREDGTLWLNLGDSYNAHPGQRKTTDLVGQKQETNKGSNSVGSRHVPTMKPKDLVGIPWLVAFALRADGWYLRQDIIWSKPNPMPESVTDRCTKAHDYVFLLSKSATYHYDAEAIKEKAAGVSGGACIGPQTKPGIEPSTAGSAEIEPCILAGSPKGGVVLDCFNGSGTTGMVAIRHGRQYIGIELKAEYLDMTRKRLSHNQLALYGCSH